MYALYQWIGPIYLTLFVVGLVISLVGNSPGKGLFAAGFGLLAAARLATLLGIGYADAPSLVFMLLNIASWGLIIAGVKVSGTGPVPAPAPWQTNAHAPPYPAPSQYPGQPQYPAPPQHGVPPAAPAYMVPCKSCGGQVAGGQMQCTHCGASMY